LVAVISLTLQIVKKTRERERVTEREGEGGRGREGENSFRLSERLFKQFDVIFWGKCIYI
jgi:hypothetical protein